MWAVLVLNERSKATYFQKKQFKSLFEKNKMTKKFHIEAKLFDGT
jgi:hypothetical protein